MSDTGFPVADGTEIDLAHQLTPSMLDTVFDLLCVERRRHLLACLRDAEADVLDLDTLAEQVQAVETDATGRRPPEYDTVLATLHHAHLPKLADGGLLDYDGRSQTVRMRRSPVLMGVLEWFAPPTRTELDMGDVFDVLRDRSRRIVLSHVRTSPSPVPIEELATRIAAREGDRPVSEVTTDQCRQIERALAHRHLPKLADLDLIDYDVGTELVTDKAITGLVASYIALAARYEPGTPGHRSK